MGLYPKDLKEYTALSGVPRGYKSNVFIVDTVNGDDSNNGLKWETPLASLEAAEDLCTTNRHDTVLFIARATADNPTAAIAWDKSYTHLIGIGCDLPGVGQRCRVVATAAVAPTPVITFSGNGCIVKNMQFNNEKASGATGVAIVSGHRNHFQNVFFMCPTSVTAASYSLKVSGTENAFERCTIGQHTLVRTAASRGLWLALGDGDCHRNRFIKCEFLSWSSVNSHAPIYTDIDITAEAYTVQFEDCLVANIVSGAGTLAVAIDDNCATTDHRIILRGKNQVMGCTAVADPLTYVMNSEVSGTASGLLMAAVNES